MKGFGDENGASDTEVFLAGDQTRASQVGRRADTLEDRGQGNERLGVGVREVVCTSSHGGGSGG